jgi:hypothetical protein
LRTPSLGVAAVPPDVRKAVWAIVRFCGRHLWVWRLCRLMCGKPCGPLFILRTPFLGMAAVPPDVRKGFAFPKS